jgi:hypothetical protein
MKAEIGEARTHSLSDKAYNYVYLEKQRAREHLGDQGVDGRAVLKSTGKK